MLLVTWRCLHQSDEILFPVLAAYLLCRGRVLRVASEFDTVLKFCSQINPDWTLCRQNAGRSLLCSAIFKLVGNAESQQNVIKQEKGNRAQFEVSHSCRRDGATLVLLLRAHSPAGHSRGAPRCRSLRTTFYFLYFSTDLQKFLKKYAAITYQ